MRKVLFFTSFFLIFFLIYPKCQNKLKVDSCYTIYQIALKEYKVDSCLFRLITDITESDSMSLTYPPSKFFYELTFATNEVDKELKVFPSRWQKVKSVDYSGIIIINHMSFLCKGIAIKHDKLFTETNNTVEITLKEPKVYRIDDIDLMLEKFIEHPALVGNYMQCGTPINVHVYTGKKLEGYTYKL